MSEERKGREGGRWINERPTSEDFALWFNDSMKVDSALKTEDYIGGVVLIPGVDTKAKHITGFQPNGSPIIETREEMSYVPYAKVETRVAYFWDLVAAHPEWEAVVEHVEAPRLPLLTPLEEVVETIVEAETGEEKVITTRKQAQAGALGQMVHQLPPGYSLLSVPVGEGYSHFLCCTIRVAIYDRQQRQERGEEALPLRSGRGTKQVPLVGSYQSRVWADNNSLMKAETGALGRALGFAGIFVIPGSGVATAEDMLEALSQGDTPSQATPAEPGNQGPAAPTAPPVRSGAEKAEDDEATLRARAIELHGQLKEKNPAKVDEFAEFAHKRNLRSLRDASGATLRGVVRKLERLLDEPVEAGSAASAPPVVSASGKGADAVPTPPVGVSDSTSGEHDPNEGDDHVSTPA